MVMYCCVPQCSSSAFDKGVRFHRFPRDPEKKNIWIMKIGKTVTETMKVCSRHFTETDYRAFPDGFPYKRRPLRPYAIPSVNLPLSSVQRLPSKKRKKQIHSRAVRYNKRNSQNTFELINACKPHRHSTHLDFVPSIFAVSDGNYNPRSRKRRKILLDEVQQHTEEPENGEHQEQQPTNDFLGETLEQAYTGSVLQTSFAENQTPHVHGNSCQDDSNSIPNSNVESNINQNVGAFPERKIVEILCFDGQQYRYLYKGTDGVLNIKLELQSGVDIFVSLEDFDKLEPADIKPSPSKLLDLIIPDKVSNEAGSEEIAQSLEPVLFDLNIKEEIEDVVDCLDSERSTSEAETMKGHEEVWPESFAQTCLENIEVYNCDVCSYTSKNKFQLQRHQTLHTKGLLFKCHLCSKTFKNKFHLKQHLKLHKKMYSCSDCDISFNEIRNLIIHQHRAHKEGTLFNCELCGKEFITKRGLKSHLIKVHEEGTFLNCELCGKELITKRGLKFHLRTIHKEKI